MGVSFCVGGCVLRECVVEGGGVYGYFGEQGLPAGIKECLERFHRRKALEKVQKLALKFVKGLRHVPYEAAHKGHYLLIKLDCLKVSFWSFNSF